MTQGFEAGAEDYIKKPFDIDELLLRVRARIHTPGTGTLTYGDIVFDPRTATLTRAGEVVDVGEIRREIWKILVENAGQTIDKGVLLELLDHPSDQALRFHISKLNQKLGIRITNVRGVGYRLEAL